MLMVLPILCYLILPFGPTSDSRGSSDLGSGERVLHSVETQYGILPQTESSFSVDLSCALLLQYPRSFQWAETSLSSHTSRSVPDLETFLLQEGNEGCNSSFPPVGTCLALTFSGDVISWPDVCVRGTTRKESCANRGFPFSPSSTLTDHTPGLRGCSSFGSW